MVIVSGLETEGAGASSGTLALFEFNIVCLVFRGGCLSPRVTRGYIEVLNTFFYCIEGGKSNGFYNQTRARIFFSFH